LYLYLFQYLVASSETAASLASAPPFRTQHLLFAPSMPRRILEMLVGLLLSMVWLTPINVVSGLTKFPMQGFAPLKPSSRFANSTQIVSSRTGTAKVLKR
jgi:hypothetical protein